jgi:hypothetical protein
MSELQKKVSMSSLNSNYKYAPGSCGFYGLAGDMPVFTQLL